MPCNKVSERWMSFQMDCILMAGSGAAVIMAAPLTVLVALVVQAWVL